MVILAGDIGGTKTNLAIFESRKESLTPLAEDTFPSAQYPSLEAILEKFLSRNKTSVGCATFGVAGPVIDGRASITNLPWVIDERSLADSFKFTSVRILNDLEATAYMIPFLKPSDLHTLNAGNANQGGTIAVIAPGTGLGEAFLTWDGSGHRVHASEGGHSDFAPGTSNEIELLLYLQSQFGHVSFEKACSGRGIRNIYRYFHKSLKPADLNRLLSEEAKQVVESEDPTPVIVHAALERAVKCQFCLSTLQMFVSILGGEAGNLALKVMATGGVYLGGGIPPRILPMLDSGLFIESFRRKGRMSELVGRIPVHVILNPKTALLGAARFGIDSIKGAS
jgi:glucokinase